MIPRRGYALPLVLIFLAVLAGSCVAALIALELSARTTGAVIGRRQAFYECDNVSRVASTVARDYLKATPAPTDAGLKLAVCGSTTTCPLAATYVEGAFGVDSMTAALSGTQTLGAIPNGPFLGVMARQNDVMIDVELTKSQTRDRCHVRQDSTVAEVKLSSFFVFVDGYAGVHPQNALFIDGRLHANGDVCLRPAGAAALRVEGVTASGRIKAATCARAAPPAGAGASSIDDASSNPQPIDGTSDSGCLACAGTGFDWRTFALQRWTGRAQDVDHAVPELRLPAANGTPVPHGTDAAGGAASNAQTLRFLVDVPRAADSADVRAARLARLADVRILNGVWYKKDAANPNAWPGVPIWSDHPVSFTTTNDGGVEGTQPVGQPDLFAGAKPTRYSHYVYDAAGQTFVPVDWSAPPVLSYGAIAWNGARHGPGVHRAACGGTGVGAVETETACLTEAERLALGARSGFTDPRVAQGSGSRGKILPINFDVAAFAAALADPSAHELGGQVPSFNGIVWIGVSWSGAHAVGAAPSSWPHVDGPTDPNVAALGDLYAAALPYPFCAPSGGTLVPNSQIPPCGTITRPNAVRVINAADLSAFATIGLTIATNGPMYLQGSFGDIGAGPFGENRTRAWLAADALTVLSPGFNDGAHAWNLGAVVTPATGNVEIAGALLVGDVTAGGAVPGDGVENAARFIENWGGASFALQGSVAVGFRSVFHTQPPNAGLFVPPARAWRHDPLFAGAVTPLPPSPEQWAPPGMPSFFVQAVKNWQRD